MVIRAISFSWLRRAASATGCALALELALAASAVARADPLLDVTADIHHDDNLTRADSRADYRADSAAAFSAVASLLLSPRQNESATVSVFTTGEAYDRYRGLSHAEIGAGASYRHKFGLGWNAPWIAWSASLSRDDYRDRLRDSTRLTSQVELGRRASVEWDGSVGAFYERRYDGHGDARVPGVSGHVFDLAARGAFARLGYAASDRLSFDARIAWRTGDVESTSRQNLAVFLASTAITDDPAFNDHDLYAYRLDGRTRSAALAASWALNDRSSLNAGWLATRTGADQGLVYRTQAVNLAYAFRY